MKDRWQAIMGKMDQASSLLVVITLLAFLMRVWGISFGLPYIYNTDEAVFVNQAVAFGSGDLNPHDFRYPTLYSYILFVLYGLYFILWLVMGCFKSVDDFAIHFFRDPTAFYLIGRSLTVLLATATVPLVYLVGRKLYNKQVGIIGALFMAFIYNHVEFSHYIKVQVPLAFFAILSFWLIYRVYERGSLSDYILAGLCCGLSTAVWQFGVFLVVPLILSHLMQVVSADAKIKSAILDMKIFWGLLCAGLGFFLGSPFALLDFRAFWRDMVGIIGYSTVTAPYDRGWFGYVSYTREAMGDILAFLTGGGLLYNIYRHRPKDILLMSYPAITIPFLSSFSNQGAYYLNPTFPFLVISAALFSVEVVSRFIMTTVRRNIALSVLGILVILLPGIAIIRWDYWISQTDTRTLAKEWIEANIPAKSKILLDSGKYYVSAMGPTLQDSEGNLRQKYQASTQSGLVKGWIGGRPAGLAHETEFYRYLVAATSGITYDLVRILHDDTLPTVEIRPLTYYKDQGVQYVVVSSIGYSRYYSSRHGFPGKAAAYRAFYESLDKEAVLIKVFKGNPTDRPGPKIKIYKLQR